MNAIKLTLAAILSFGLAAGVFYGSAPAETLRLAHHHAVGGTVDLTAKKLAELVEQKSGGALKIRIFPAAQLGQEAEAMALVNQGAVDLSITSLGHMDDYWPPVNVSDLPFIWRGWEHAFKAYGGAYGAALKKGVRDHSNLELLGFLHFGFRDMIFRGPPVTSVGGMKGMKMRSPESQVWIRMFQLLDARPTPVTWGEVYTAMQTGVAEGLESPPKAALDMKFNEVTKSLVRTNHMFGSMAVTVNKNRLDGLSSKLRQVLREAGEEATDWANKTISQPGEQQAYSILKQKGIAVVDPDNPAMWSNAMKPLWDEVAGRDPDGPKMVELLVNTR
jgi:tripartite ATP-independent transporter DctP family solute receptor